MLKKCISEVIVDRETNSFHFQIRKVPAVTPELEKQFANRKQLTITLANIVSAASSGRTNYSALTRFARVKIKELLPKEGTPAINQRAQHLAV